MDNYVPSHDVPHPEWVGWSNDKRECMEDDKIEQRPENVPVPSALPVKKPCGCWKRAIIFFLLLIVLILSYFLWKKWKSE